jgi:hypothetical protein
VSTYVKLPFSLRVFKKYIFEKYPNGKYKISKFITLIAPFKQGYFVFFINFGKNKIGTSTVADTEF